MELRELSRDEYMRTILDPMTPTDDDEGPHFNVADYVARALGPAVSDWGVPRAYTSGDGKFLHVLVDFGRRNVNLVVVVDIPGREIFGHYTLDLNLEYGLDRTPPGPSS